MITLEQTDKQIFLDKKKKLEQISIAQYPGMYSKKGKELHLNMVFRLKEVINFLDENLKEFKS
jgi:hypothetical protein